MTDITAHGAPLKLWLNYWRLARWYHRFETHGMEHLNLPTAALLVGYHGRPAAFDLAMLTVEIYEQLGYLPHGIFHRAYAANPVTHWLMNGLGGVVADGDRLQEAVSRKEHILTAPGGSREGMRSFLKRYQVNWGKRTGYLKLAIKYGIPIVPIGASGVDDAYIGLLDGYTLGKKLGLPLNLPLWAGVGISGPCPFTLPIPVKITQVIGPPIEVQNRVDPDDRTGLLEVHREVATTVQKLIDQARSARK